MIYESNNFKDLMNNPLRLVYGIEKKDYNLKTLYTAKLNKKMRIRMSLNGNYPYDLINIKEIYFEEIDNNHYERG